MHGQSYARARSCLEPWALCAALCERATWRKLRKTAPALPLMSGRCRHLRLHQSEPPLPCPLWRHASALSRPPPLSIASIQLCSRLASPRLVSPRLAPLRSAPLSPDYRSPAALLQRVCLFQAPYFPHGGHATTGTPSQMGHGPATPINDPRWPECGSILEYSHL
jgi:hypothetical protein